VRLAGHTSAYYLPASTAAATYLSQAQASATYETTADAAKLVDPTQAIPLPGPAPTFPTDTTSAASWPVTTSAAGRMVVDISFVMNSFSCFGSGHNGAWFLTLDGANIATSFADTPFTSGAWPFAIHTVTDASVPAGSHTLQLMFGCQGADFTRSAGKPRTTPW
jgi:hypothetical protein